MYFISMFWELFFIRLLEQFSLEYPTRPLHNDITSVWIEMEHLPAFFSNPELYDLVNKQQKKIIGKSF